MSSDVFKKKKKNCLVTVWEVNSDWKFVLVTVLQRYPCLPLLMDCILLSWHFKTELKHLMFLPVFLRLSLSCLDRLCRSPAHNQVGSSHGGFPFKACKWLLTPFNLGFSSHIIVAPHMKYHHWWWSVTFVNINPLLKRSPSCEATTIFLHQQLLNVSGFLREPQSHAALELHGL